MANSLKIQSGEVPEYLEKRFEEVELEYEEKEKNKMLDAKFAKFFRFDG